LQVTLKLFASLTDYLPAGSLNNRVYLEAGEYDSVADIIELRQPIVEAAEADARADVALYEAEAAATEEPGRRAALLVEVARLAETAPAVADGERAGDEAELAAARRADAMGGRKPRRGHHRSVGARGCRALRARGPHDPVAEWAVETDTAVTANAVYSATEGQSMELLVHRTAALARKRQQW
jgi:hypothetical protein